MEQKQITPGRLVEPRPPRRPSDVYDEEETPEGFREKIEDNEDIAVDAVMEFGSGNTPNVDETTPMSSTGSVDDDNLPMTYATTLPNELPPSPPGVCDSALEVTLNILSNKNNYFRRNSRSFLKRSQGDKI